MSIYFDKSRRRYRFEFDRIISGRRVRATKLLPKAWTQAQADAFDREESSRLYAIAQGIEQESPLIEAAVQTYLEKKSELKSHATAMGHLAAVFEYYEGKRFSDLSEVCEKITEAGLKRLAPATVRQRIVLLRAACRFYWKTKRLNMPDPGQHLAMPEVRNERHEYLTRRQALQLARACKRRPARALILIAFYTGMRKGEIWAARVEPGRFVLEDTKNGDRRVVPMLPKIARYASRHLPPKISYRSMMIWFRKAAEAVNRPGLHFHDLRHSTASAMVQAGTPLYTVGKVLGHKSARSTARYSHLSTENLADALGAISQKRVGKS
ncbi:site-specific integrase [Bordetella avium]|nr:site-specific integrase [Bordetella avium]RIQ67286.1 site-specific integrase [Bordetella avium]